VVGRLGIADVSPVVGSLAPGEYPARAVVGEVVPISATVFREGHDAVGASVVLRAPGADGAGGRERTAPGRMVAGAPGTDRWHASVVFDRPGLWTFAIEAFGDPLATWYHAITVKVADGQDADDLANDFETGARLLTRFAKAVTKPGTKPGTNPAGPASATPISTQAGAAAAALRDTSLTIAERIGPALNETLLAAVTADPIREFLTRSPSYEVLVDRERALFGSWYEFFPRSIGAVLAGDADTPARPLRHGTLKDATKHLDYVAALGFDVVYLPPVHPIGSVNRKGPNNSLEPAAWDVGSPWAIGSKDGGHDAVHPDLGTMADFVALVRQANRLGMEVALDLALQTAPDHPWVAAHPEWFTTKPDGTIAYAENPPKKYQDIYPLNFDNDPHGIYTECLRVVEVWIDAGVKIFRVDNPHTKPLNFWHKLITAVKKRHPDVLFLAEAFTRPAMMAALAKIGFTQSYTYFTWRNSKPELEEYEHELVAATDYMRPNFFVNTPDILTEYLQTGGPTAFAIRAVLAATLSPSWGVYSGFELYEWQPVHVGSEEYLDSEKYQLRPRDFATAQEEGRSLAPLLTRLNAIRNAHPALRGLRNLRPHDIDNDAILAYSKRDEATGDTILVLCSTDPRGVQAGWTSLDLPALGLDWDEHATVRDLLTDDEYTWGRFNFVSLDPSRPAHIFAVTARIPA
jgi:starch synthase (maltosyl-transferring)